MSRALGLLVLATLLVRGALSAQETCSPVPVDAHSLHACVSGGGPRTVVLAAGAGQTSRTWNDVVPQLSTFAQVVTFDRPGLGRSEPGVEPRTPTRIAQELHALLEALAVQGPTVLVGHSMGGVHVLRYATLFPESVEGVVLLDSPPPGFEEDRLELLAPGEREERKRLLERSLSNVPPTVRLEREGANDAKAWDFTAFPRGIPLIVVVADSQDFGNLGSLLEHRRLWVERSRQWLELSDRAELVVARGSGHMVHQDSPALVVEIVRKLLAGS